LGDLRKDSVVAKKGGINAVNYSQQKLESQIEKKYGSKSK
jgi:hypothetical protein